MTHAEMRELLAAYFISQRTVTQKDFAERAGVTSVTICALMQNKTPNRKLHAITVAKMLAAMKE